MRTGEEKIENRGHKSLLEVPCPVFILRQLLKHRLPVVCRDCSSTSIPGYFYGAVCRSLVRFFNQDNLRFLASSLDRLETRPINKQLDLNDG